MGYCTKQELSEEIRTHQIKGVVSDNLQRIIDSMALGICKKYHIIDCSDIIQDCWIWFLTNSNKINLDANPFAYLTTCFMNVVRGNYRKKEKYISLDLIPDNILPASAFSGAFSNSFCSLAGYKSNGKYVVATEKEIVSLWHWAGSNKYKTIKRRIDKGFAPSEVFARKDSMAQQAIRSGKNPKTVNNRIRLGWSVKEALEIPISKREVVIIEGISRRQWALNQSISCGVSAATIYTRLRRGKTLEQAIKQV